MLRSIYLVSRLKQVGPINQAFNITSGLDKSEVRPLVVTLFDELPGNSWLNKYIDGGIEVISLKASKWKLNSATKRLDKIIAERGIDIVHSSGISADFVNRKLKSKVVKITTIRSNINDLHEDGNLLVRHLIRHQFIKNLKGIPNRVACSDSLASNISNDTGMSCSSIPNGVNIDIYKPVDSDQKIALRKKLNLPTTDKIIVSIGIFYTRKRMGQILQAFTELQTNGYTLVMVGGGEEYETLQNKYAHLPNVIFTGSVSNPLEYYQSADIFVSASVAEGLPNSVLEALACGLPVVLSDIGPHKECIQQDIRAGLLYQQDNEAELKKALKESFNWDLDTKSQIASSLAITHLSKYVMARKYAELYKKLTAK